MLIIPMACFKCLENSGDAQPNWLLPPMNRRPLEWNDDNWYKFICPFGHENYFRVQLLRFQILFDMGVSALAKGYLREAIISTYSALEDLSRMFCLVYAEANGLNAAQINELSNALTLSERRTGAFELALALTKSEGVAVLRSKSRSWRELRNKIVHEGHFPSRDIAIKHCEQLYTFMNLVCREMARQYPDIVEKAVLTNLGMGKTPPVEVNAATAAIAPAVSLEDGADPITPFSEVLARAEAYDENTETLRVLADLAMNEMEERRD